MPGPKSNPQPVEKYRDDVLALRRKAKPNRKAHARLEARQIAWQNESVKKTAHGFEMHKPGSQNRNK